MWGLHTVTTLPIAVVVIGFVFLINQYVACALVSPRLDGEDGMDMHRLHEQQGRAYVGSRENVSEIAMLPAVIAPLIWRARWIQISAPIPFIALLAAVMITIHPVLR